MSCLRQVGILYERCLIWWAIGVVHHIVNVSSVSAHFEVTHQVQLPALHDGPKKEDSHCNRCLRYSPTLSPFEVLSIPCDNK